MKTIGIKLADGTFYPILEEGQIGSKAVDLTTIQTSQTIVHVDVYRSETNSMDDAEYVDTLEIQNLQTQEKDLNNLSLNIGIDENNQLKAEIVESATGKSSETQVNLDTVGKSDDTISFDKDDNSTLDNFSEQLKVDDLDFDTVTDDFITESLDDIKVDSTPEDLTQEDITLPVFDNDGFASNEETQTSAPDNINEPVVDSVEDDLASLQNPNPFEEDISLDSLAENLEDNFETEELSLPKVEEEVSVPSESESVPETDMSLPNFDDLDVSSFDSPVDTSESVPEDDLSLPNFDNLDSPSLDSSLDLPLDSSESVTEDDLSLPNFDDLDATSLDSPVASSDSLIEDDLSLPNFDDLDATSLDSPVKRDQPAQNSAYSEETLAAINESFENQDDFFAKESNQDIFDSSAPTGMFDDLFDDETKEGKSASYDSTESDKKHLKTPVIICIICAVICVLAAFLVLCFVPSKVKKTAKLQTQSVEKQAKADSIIPENTAKEETIVVYTNPETVVPSIPEVTPTENVEDIKYKIIWGDTLWDISTAYYKTPWKYNFIANYNNIKNPDKIIAGTYILIPAK